MSIDSEFATLHLVIGHHGLKAPAPLLMSLADQDCIILMQDAVWLALAAPAQSDVWSSLPMSVSIKVLVADLDVRGLSERALHPRIERIDDDGWVVASERHPRCITWGSAG